jgi:hypothetical protein
MTGRGATDTAEAPGREVRWPLICLVMLVALVLYWRGPLLGFAGDDALVLYHLRRLGGLRHPALFFSALDFFSYYRPIAFLTFALDAAICGMRAGAFHITNVVLHAANGALVFALGRRLLAPWAAALAAVLFVAHTSSQEAVYWISARFDVLATLLVLTTVVLATRRRPAWVAASLVTFALGLLSKEAALAAPLIVGAYLVFVDRAPARRVVTVLVLMLGVIAGYSVMRTAVGGLDPTGGTSRLPKAVMLIGAVVLLMVLARGGWDQLLARLGTIRPGRALAAGLALLAAATALCALPSAGTLVREKLSFAGYAGFYLLSPAVAPAPPPYFLDPSTPVYWLGGIAVLLFAGAVAVALRRRLASDATWWFVLWFIAASLLPVSSLTDGQRYLYLGSAGVSIGLAKLTADLQGTGRKVMVVLLGIVLAVSVWQIQWKGADWAWASNMTSHAAALVNTDLPACGQGDVVFLVAPVGIRGVYSHFYHQTFSQDGGCEPGSYQALVRMVRIDEPVEVRWTLPRTVTVRAPVYEGNFVLSRDLHAFTVEQRDNRTARIATPLGLVTSRPDGAAQEVTLELDPSLDLRRLRFYYFAEGAVRRARSPEPERSIR